MQKNEQIFEISDEKSLVNIVPTLKKWDKIFFYGDLGAGKTTFIRAILRKFFDDEKIIVRSPTYTYYQEYSDATHGKVFHFDLYRLDDLENFYLIGSDEIVQNSESIALIEWPEILDESVQPTKKIFISYDENSGKRIFRIEEIS